MEKRIPEPGDTQRKKTLEENEGRDVPSDEGEERLETGNISIRVFPRDVVLPRHDPYPPSMFLYDVPSLS